MKQTNKTSNEEVTERCVATGKSNPYIEDTWYGVILWVLRVLGQGLKSECADIFHQSFLWLLRHTDEPQKGQNSCLSLQSRSVLTSFGVVLMSCRIDFHVVRSTLQYSACRI